MFRRSMVHASKFLPLLGRVLEMTLRRISRSLPSYLLCGQVHLRAMERPQNSKEKQKVTAIHYSIVEYSLKVFVNLISFVLTVKIS